MNWFLLAFISAVFSAFAAISEKKVLFTLDAVNFSFIVSVITLLFSIPFFFLVNLSTVTSISLVVLFFKTALSAGAFLCVMYSIKNLEISEALPLLAVSPGLVAIAGVVFINDRLEWIEWFGILLLVIGAYILENKKENKNLFAPLRALFNFSKYSYVLIALALFTISSLLDRVLLTGYKLPPFTFMAFQQLFYAIIFLLFILIKQKGAIRVTAFFDRKILFLIVAISLFTVVYRYTQIEATKMAPVALVIAVKRLSVLFAVVFGGKLFSEENLARKILAVVIILVGATLIMNNG